MDYKKRIEIALAYIEEHLMDQLTIDEIARAACWSKFHFQRTFHIFTGYTVFDYLLKRRITESASQLLQTDKKIIDIAFDFDFKSHEHYIRAFKKMFNLTPRAFRKARTSPVLKTIKPISMDSFSFSKQWDKLFIGFEDMEEQSYWGLSCNSMNQQEIMKLWGSVLSVFSNPFELTFMGMLSYPQSFDLDISFSYTVLVNKEYTTLSSVKVPKAQYACFEYIGSVHNLPEIYQYIYGAWLDKKGLQNNFGFDLECYPKGFKDPQSNENCFHIKIPVSGS